jgi:hypothetical protein
MCHDVTRGKQKWMHWTALVLASALGSGFGPFAAPRAPVTSDAARARSPIDAGDASRIVHLPWRAYRATVGSFQGPRCPHVPSCSVYALRAVGRHGVLAGGAIATQRLLRGSRSSAVRALRRDREGRYLDPLEDATFWLGKGSR